MRAFGILGVLIAVAIGAYIFTQQAKSSSPDAGNPRTEVDVVGVRMDLVNMAQAERSYYAREGHYASLDDMRTSGDLQVRNDHRGPYAYSAIFSDSGFQITATYDGPPQPEAPQSLHIDQGMQVTQ